jgi:PQQ-dependent dehydrogenase (methanol/ethanol family)
LPNEQLKIAEKELGIRTWLKPQQEKDGWQNGGGAVTGYFSFDPKTNLVYYGTGNPGVWNPDVRPGDNKWASSVFARDVDTGQAKWAMQTTPHDEWDYDATNEVILFEQKDKNNKTQTYATQINKNGFIYTWQANNGTLIAAEKVHPFVNWATGVDLNSGVPAKDPKYSTHQDFNREGICPSNLGAKGIAPATYSPKTHLVYVPQSLDCMNYEAVQSRYAQGQAWTGSMQIQMAWDDGKYMNRYSQNGSISAINPIDGKLHWQSKENYTFWGGMLVTATNLVFYGNLERWFKALDAKTGKELWKFQVGSGIIGNSFTYSNKGKQYIGVISGIGGWPGHLMFMGNCRGIDLCFSDSKYGALEYVNATPGGGAINVFSL